VQKKPQGGGAPGAYAPGPNDEDEATNFCAKNYHTSLLTHNPRKLQYTVRVYSIHTNACNNFIFSTMLHLTVEMCRIRFGTVFAQCWCKINIRWLAWVIL
jgi:hypothetical protein